MSNLQWVSGDKLPGESDFYIAETVTNANGIKTGRVQYLQYIKGADHFMGLSENETVHRWLLETESHPSIEGEEKLGEWQVCPKCVGQGVVSRPLWIPADIPSWSSGTTDPYTCPVCEGARIIARPTESPSPALPVKEEEKTWIEFDNPLFIPVKVDFKDASGNEYKGVFSSMTKVFYAYGISGYIKNITHWRPQTSPIPAEQKKDQDPRITIGFLCENHCVLDEKNDQEVPEGDFDLFVTETWRYGYGEQPEPNDFRKWAKAGKMFYLPQLESALTKLSALTSENTALREECEGCKQALENAINQNVSLLEERERYGVAWDKREKVLQEVVQQRDELTAKVKELQEWHDSHC
jgi:hypothetical protein